MSIDGIDAAGASSPDKAAPAAMPGGPFHRAIFFTGSAGLLLATATDALSVLGRHTGIPLLGSIEVVQCARLLIASSAMIGATLLRAHASVHIFTERMRPDTVRKLDRATSLMGAALFAIMVAGSVWVFADLWPGHERTELLHIPSWPLRAIWIAAACTVCGLFVAQAFRKTKS